MCMRCNSIIKKHSDTHTPPHHQGVHWESESPLECPPHLQTHRTTALCLIMELVEELQTEAWILHGAIALFTIAARRLRIADPPAEDQLASSSAAGMGPEEEYFTVQTLALACFIMCIEFDPQGVG